MLLEVLQAILSRSHFHDFVKRGLYDVNWGSNTDIKEIIDLDFE